MSWSDQTAKSDFDRAHFKSFMREIVSKVYRTNNKLLPFDEVRKALPLYGQFDLGMREIPIDNIIGSVNRSQDFDRAFLPRENHIRSRWVNIDKARLEEVELPPIEVYKIGEVYFVIDGNHRVSVARERGQMFIDAHVTEIKVPFNITSDADWHDAILKYEREKFYENTYLKNIRPDANINLTLVGQYQTLLEHINAHRWYLGERYQPPVGWDEAVLSWYKKVYMPIVRVIRSRQIMKDFPGRTEGDLYLWIIQHQYYLAQDSGKDVPAEQAASHFADKYSANLGKRVRYLLHKIRKRFKDIFLKQ